MHECLGLQIYTLSNLSLLPFLFFALATTTAFSKEEIHATGERTLQEESGANTSPLQPAHCVILGKSPPFSWSGFLHLQNGHNNFCCSSLYLWHKGQIRTCEKLIAKQQNAFNAKTGEEAVAEAICREVLRLHPSRSTSEEGLRGNALGKCPSSSLSGKAW